MVDPREKAYMRTRCPFATVVAGREKNAWPLIECIRLESRNSVADQPQPLWQQRRREQIPRGNTENTEEKDPKGRPPERT